MANVFFDVTFGNDQPRRITFKLYDNVVPKTAANFRALCTGGYFEVYFRKGIWIQGITLP
jgi:peptidylprolyl isomerase